MIEPRYILRVEYESGREPLVIPNVSQERMRHLGMEFLDDMYSLHGQNVSSLSIERVKDDQRKR